MYLPAMCSSQSAAYDSGMYMPCAMHYTTTLLCCTIVAMLSTSYGINLNSDILLHNR